MYIYIYVCVCVCVCVYKKQDFYNWPLTEIIKNFVTKKRYFADYSLVYLVLNLFVIVLCGFVYFCNVWWCVCVGFVLYGCVRLM